MPFTKWEYILYSAVSIIPFIVLLYLSFKNHLRFGMIRSIAITIPFAAVWNFIQFAAIYYYLPWIGLADVVIPLIVIFLLVILFNDHFGRILDLRFFQSLRLPGEILRGTYLD